MDVGSQVALPDVCKIACCGNVCSFSTDDFVLDVFDTDAGKTWEIIGPVAIQPQDPCVFQFDMRETDQGEDEQQVATVSAEFTTDQNEIWRWRVVLDGKTYLSPEAKYTCETTALQLDTIPVSGAYAELTVTGDPDICGAFKCDCTLDDYSAIGKVRFDGFTDQCYERDLDGIEFDVPLNSPLGDEVFEFEAAEWDIGFQQPGPLRYYRVVLNMLCDPPVLGGAGNAINFSAGLLVYADPERTQGIRSYSFNNPRADNLSPWTNTITVGPTPPPIQCNVDTDITVSVDYPNVENPENPCDGFDKGQTYALPTICDEQPAALRRPPRPGRRPTPALTGLGRALYSKHPELFPRRGCSNCLEVARIMTREGIDGTRARVDELARSLAATSNQPRAEVRAKILGVIDDETR